ncbi:UNVERIFIED_CONTAM: hypothetical protein GTU68_007388 [Idotea baltica]|nr:hypothetical protein [Idotea baltica]
MGLAPYGEAKYTKEIYDNLLDLKEDGSYHLNLEYFNYMSGLTMTNSKFSKLFGAPPRKPESPLSQKEMDLARSIQVVVEEVMLRQARYIHKETGIENLCMAGGVALNCVGNGRVLREGPFKNIWIQPAAGDAGGALGAALCAWHGYLKNERKVNPAKDSQFYSLLGPQYSEDQVNEDLKDINPNYKKLDDSSLSEEVSELLANQKVIGWFQGRMEFGPRALGNRSIIGDPRSTEMQSKMNLKIKYRESFRPFAPIVIKEDASDFFDIDCESPYMLLVAPVTEKRRIKMTGDQEDLFGIEKLNVPKSDIPAITHVDYSARIETVSKDQNSKLYDLMQSFKSKTDCSVLVNTSFNVRGEPIVCTPKDAYRCFMRTEMDCLVINNYLFLKEDQPEWKEEGNWRDEFALD